MTNRKCILAELESLEERLAPKLPSPERMEVVFYTEGLILPHSLVTIKHRHQLHKQRSMFLAESVKCINDGTENSFVALLEPVTD